MEHRVDTGPLHAETIEAHPQSQTCAVTGTVYTFLPKGPGPPTRTAAPHCACLQVDEHEAEARPAGATPAVPRKDATCIQVPLCRVTAS